MKTTLTALFGFISGLNPMFLSLFTATTTVLAAFTWINDHVAQLMSRVDSLTVGSFAGTLAVSPLGFLNTFIPVAEAITYFTGYLAVLALCATIRIIKSFVPTVAS